MYVYCKGSVDVNTYTRELWECIRLLKVIEVSRVSHCYYEVIMCVCVCVCVCVACRPTWRSR